MIKRAWWLRRKWNHELNRARFPHYCLDKNLRAARERCCHLRDKGMNFMEIAFATGLPFPTVCSLTGLVDPLSMTERLEDA